MKTLTTLTAVVALIAGVSIASAAGMEKDNSMGASSMSKPARGHRHQHNYCIKTKSGELILQVTRAWRPARAAPSGATCVANPHTSTTGSK